MVYGYDQMRVIPIHFTLIPTDRKSGLAALFAEMMSSNLTDSAVSVDDRTGTHDVMEKVRSHEPKRDIFR